MPNVFNFNLIKPLVLCNFQIQAKQKKQEQDKLYCKESIRQIQTVDTQEKWSDYFNKSVYLGEEEEGTIVLEEEGCSRLDPVLNKPGIQDVWGTIEETNVGSRIISLVGCDIGIVVT